MAVDFGNLESFSLNNIHMGTTYGLYLGSQDSGLRNENIIPEHKQHTEEIVGMNGAYIFNENLTPRQFSLKCFISECTENDFRALQQTLSFRGKSKKLILDRRPYKYLNVMINGKIDWDFIWNDRIDLGDYYNAFIEIPFIAYDPLFYSNFDSTTLPGYLEDISSNPNILYYDSGMPFADDILPSSIDLSATPLSSTPISFQLYQGGNYYSKPTISLIGEGTNIKLHNITTDQEFTISSMTGNETILVNSQKGMITDGSQTMLKTSKFNGNFIIIDPGINELQLTGNGTISNLTITYKYCYL